MFIIIRKHTHMLYKSKRNGTLKIRHLFFVTHLNPFLHVPFITNPFLPTPFNLNPKHFLHFECSYCHLLVILPLNSSHDSITKLILFAIATSIDVSSSPSLASFFLILFLIVCVCVCV